MRVLSILALLVPIVVGCAPRPGSDVLQPYVPAPHYTSKVELLVATTRQRGTTEDPAAYSAERSERLNYAALTVSIPKAHVAGQIEWPDQTPADPLLHFVTTQRQVLAGPQFLDQVRQRAKTGGTEAGNVLVFVHGYNTLYEEAVYRFAQIVHDSGFNGTVILFAWPSRGKAPLYLADRDSSTYSRDYLEQTLHQIAGVQGVREVNILAHSMGSWLAVETLRQATLKGDRDLGGKLGDVILASPDLDVGVFLTQLDVIGRLRRPMTILVSGDDKVLALSTALSGGVKRVGLVTAEEARVVEKSQKYNLRVIDLTAIDAGNGSGHAKYAEAGAVLHAMGRSLAAGDKAKNSEQSGFVAAVAEVGSSLVKIPAAIIGVPLPQ
jgi:esterase/lipase superfamily enzyme